jgi:endonuclease/exonuclease/phosphatase family metal-dependent hydrolase
MTILANAGHATSSCSITSTVFHVATYNILAKSLGTNTIPWVMTVSPLMQRRIQEATSRPSFKDWVDTALKPEYMTHFHKNFASGNYATMRQFWGTPHCHGPHDIPRDLTGLEWVEDNVVRYPASTASVAETTAGGGSLQATTLQGMAHKLLPPALAHDFFQEVSSSEEQIYAWPVRGPRIFATATQFQIANTVTKGGDELRQHLDGTTNTALSTLSPDIVALQEYDCHEVVADYRSPGCSETFADAMAQVGYDGVFFKDPLPGRDPPSGLGVFWKREIFEPATGSGPTTPSASTSRKFGVMTTLECNTEALEGDVYNVDLQEHWHSIKDTPNQDATLMNAADRRNAALCRLRHKSTGRAVTICAAHLMTTSRDCAKTNRFPGQVRAGEIATLKALVEERTDLDDAVLVVGDFNTDAKVAPLLFSGAIKSSRSDANTDEKTLQLDTGFDEGNFLWGPHALEDAFRSVHHWGETVGEGQFCTSRNAERIEWIDYQFFDPRKLRPSYVSLCKTPPSAIPNHEHPSDHLPLFATFEFV